MIFSIKCQLTLRACCERAQATMHDWFGMNGWNMCEEYILFTTIHEWRNNQILTGRACKIFPHSFMTLQLAAWYTIPGYNLVTQLTNQIPPPICHIFNASITLFFRYYPLLGKSMKLVTNITELTTMLTRLTASGIYSP